MKTLWQEMIKAGWAIGGADSRRLVASGRILVNEEVATSFDQEVKSNDVICRLNGHGRLPSSFRVTN